MVSGLLKQLAGLSLDRSLSVGAIDIRAFELPSSKGVCRCIEFMPKAPNSFPPIVGMHGNSGSLNDLAICAFHLAERFGFHVALFDAPFHGLSPKSAQWTWRVHESKCVWFREALTTFMTERAKKKRVILLAHSMGGEVVFQTELHCQEAQVSDFAIAGLAVINPLLPSFSPVKPPPLWRFQAQLPKALVRAVGHRFLPLAYRHLFHDFAKFKSNAVVEDWLEGNMILFTQGKGVFSRDFVDMFQGDVHEALAVMDQGQPLVNEMLHRWHKIGGMKKPILWFCDLKDNCIPPAHQKAVVQVLHSEFSPPFLHLIESQDSGHMLSITHGLEIAQAIHQHIHSLK